MNVFARKFSNRIDTLKNTFIANDDIDHNLTKGTLNEEELYSLIQDVVPAKYRFGKGIIINKENEQSNETDIFIYDDSIIPPYIKNTVTLVPIEAVSYAIEVKTKLNSTELKTTIKKFEQLQKMGHDKERLLFAFSNDLTSKSLKTDLKRYYDEEGDTFYFQPAITALCVSNKYCYFKITNEYYMRDVLSSRELQEKLMDNYSNIPDNEDYLTELYQHNAVSEKYKETFYKLGRMKNKLNIHNFDFPKTNQDLKSMGRLNFIFYIKEVIDMIDLSNRIEQRNMMFGNVNYNEMKFKVHKWIGIENTDMEKRDNEIELSLLSQMSNYLTNGHIVDYLLSQETKNKIKVFSVCCEDHWGNISSRKFEENGLQDYDLNNDLNNFKIDALGFSEHRFKNNTQQVIFSLRKMNDNNQFVFQVI